MSRVWLAMAALVLAGTACAGPGTPPPIPTAHVTPVPAGQTAYGFFPSPPRVTMQSVLDHYQDLARHADVVLLQQNIPWEAFPLDGASEPQPLIDIRNQVILARQNGLEPVFVVDPLNGLNRSEFMGLPGDWEASFAEPRVRQAFRAFSLWILDTFEPRYLGLASEINSYADAYPQDFEHYLSLYQETHDAIKQSRPQTQVFVTFQWEDLNNLIPAVSEGRRPYQTNWDQVEAFEPRLDLWVISSYPFIVFRSAAEIPQDYYSPLLARTGKPLAVAEGGYTSTPVGLAAGSAQDQIGYLQAIDSQIGPRLAFWIYLLLADLDLDSYARVMQANGVPDRDVDTLGMFAYLGLQTQDGDAKPALDTWDSIRSKGGLP